MAQTVVLQYFTRDIISHCSDSDWDFGFYF